MNRRVIRGLAIALAIAAPVFVNVSSSHAAVLAAGTVSSNGGSAAWAMFFDLSATSALTVTDLTTASTGGVGAAYSIEVFTRTGTALGGPLASGPGSSSAGWTSIGIASAIQGDTANGVSLPIDVPDIAVVPGVITGVALRFIGAGPRYAGTGTPALSTFADSTLTLVTGDARSAPFGTTGSYFTSRAMVGSLTYTAAIVPEPAALASLAPLAMMVLRRRR